jgi:hypothetical protein
MSLRRTVTSSLRCAHCQNSVLSSFIGLSSPRPIRVANASVADSQWSLDASSRRKNFVVTRNFSQTARSRNGNEPAEDNLLEEAEKRARASAAVAPLPWYLQVSQAKPTAVPSSPAAARQRIPDLPDHPPPILPDVLSHISVDLGLDDLTLFDLRDLDPPPALGANLIMIVGSARSEKHLHVSADRFCRWLRSNYKLSPHADGLLGRNELKLKLRRKAKRLRLMANAGASESLASDDGIRTGWICVNVGQVQPAESAPTKVRRKEGFVGFGADDNGVSIVVQMLTEERRADVDLEGLWSRVLKRAEREKGALEGQESDEQEDPTNRIGTESR